MLATVHMNGDKRYFMNSLHKNKCPNLINSLIHFTGKTPAQS